MIFYYMPALPAEEVAAEEVLAEEMAANVSDHIDEFFNF